MSAAADPVFRADCGCDLLTGRGEYNARWGRRAAPADPPPVGEEADKIGDCIKAL